jgi:choice-of-anchor A domain-containing protein
MRPKFLLLAAALLSPSAFAQSNLLPFLVFSKTSIQSQQSDYQGHTGAMGAIDLVNYEIVGDLESASSIRVEHGSVRGTIKAPNISLKKATGKRGKYTTSVQGVLNSASSEMDSIAMKLSALATTGKAEQGTAILEGRQVSGLKFTAARDLEVIDVTADELNRTGEILIDGSGLLLIRVSGSNVNLRHKAIHMVSGIRPEQIVFFFPDARSIELSYSGGARDRYNGTHWGIPGSVVAPNALVHFAEILVTGQLYVGQICTDRGLNGGQVNAGYSILLKQLSEGCGNTAPRCR